MKILKLTVLAASVMALPLAGTVQGQIATTNITSTSVNSLIPDGNPTGLSSSTSISGVYSLNYITSVTVNLDITGGFNGDLYAYLAGPAGEFTVLLNRTGITSGNSFGYSDTGFNITFSDGSPNIHLYQNDSPSYNGGGQLTGTWAPDGRNIDPQSAPSAFDSASPTADLSAFNGNSPNGTWTLFVADMSSGGQGTLVSWGLTVVTVPEPQTWVLVAGGVGVLLALNRRRKL
jgi:subtilisin-like proprotein convertase family protein